jgi:peptide deformylase
MKTITARAGTALLSLVLCTAVSPWVLTACGDDDAAEPDGGDADADTDTDADSDTDTGTGDGSLAVETVSPEDGAVVRMNQKIAVVFSAGSEGDFIDPATVEILVDGEPVPALEYYAEATGNREFHFVPLPVWEPSSEHEVTVVAGAAYSGDSSLELAEDYVWSFTVEDAPLLEEYDEATTAAPSEDEIALMEGIQDGAFLEEELVKSWTDPESALYEVSAAVRPDDSDVVAFCEKLLASLNPLGAVGLAAPQFGVGRRLFVAAVNGERRAFINPIIETTSDTLYYGSPEGCLSIDGISSIVGRPDAISVEFDTPEGEHVTGYALQSYGAEVFLHEYDHLNGILMTDREERRSW